MKTTRHLFPFVAFLVSAVPALPSTYYVDATLGNDNNSGTAAPWKSLAKINQTDFKPGDHILLHSGSVWHEQLQPRTSGAPNAPIVFDHYGDGPRPRIDANGTIEDAVLIRNIEQIEIHNLEITNQGTQPAVRRGVHIVLDNFGTATH